MKGFFLFFLLISFSLFSQERARMKDNIEIRKSQKKDSEKNILKFKDAILLVRINLREKEITYNNLDIEFSIYPNPAKNQISVDFSSKNNKSSDLIISDILGKTVKEFSVNSSNGINRIHINLNNLND